jgi:hypothetical protein
MSHMNDIALVGTAAVLQDIHMNDMVLVGLYKMWKLGTSL